MKRLNRFFAVFTIVLLFLSFFPLAQASPDTATFYPNNYSLLGSTKLVSGSVSNLQSNDGSYMQFRSYVSASSTTAKTDAFCVYEDGTTTANTPKERTWTGESASWGSEAELPTSGSAIRFARVAYCPLEARSFEKIVVTSSADSYLDAYVWDGTGWSVTNNIGVAGYSDKRPFDIAYEKTSGEALLVYYKAPSTNFQIAYQTWSFASGWSGESTYVIDAANTGRAYWITMASKPTSGANEIAVGIMSDDTLDDAYGLIWGGSSFVSQQLLTDTSSIQVEECIAVAYEQTSGYATCVSSTGHAAFSWQWSGSAWDASATTFDLSGTSTPNWFTLKADPTSGSDKLFCVCVDGGTDLNTAYWSGSAWTLHTEHDDAINSHATRPADFAWESTGNKGLLVWGTADGTISYKSYTAPDSWGTQQNPSFGELVQWVQLRGNPRAISGDMKILGAIYNDDVANTLYYLGAIRWDGSTFTVIGSTTFSDNAISGYPYECYEMEYMNFGPPSQFTSQVEFTGTSNTETWTSLNWTIDSCFTTTSVTTTFQLYNYNTGQYPESGDGYMTDTIGTSDVFKSQLITTNPTYFRDGSGNWKTKITGVKSTSSQFDWKADLVRLIVEWAAEAQDLTFVFWQTIKPTATSLAKKELAFINTQTFHITSALTYGKELPFTLAQTIKPLSQLVLTKELAFKMTQTLKPLSQFVQQKELLLGFSQTIKPISALTQLKELLFTTSQTIKPLAQFLTQKELAFTFTQTTHPLWTLIMSAETAGKDLTFILSQTLKPIRQLIQQKELAFTSSQAFKPLSQVVQQKELLLKLTELVKPLSQFVQQKDLGFVFQPTFKPTWQLIIPKELAFKLTENVNPTWMLTQLKELLFAKSETIKPLSQSTVQKELAFKLTQTLKTLWQMTMSAETVGPKDLTFVFWRTIKPLGETETQKEIARTLSQTFKAIGQTMFNKEKAWTLTGTVKPTLESVVTKELLIKLSQTIKLESALEVLKELKLVLIELFETVEPTATIEFTPEMFIEEINLALVLAAFSFVIAMVALSFGIMRKRES